MLFKRASVKRHLALCFLAIIFIFVSTTRIKAWQAIVDRVTDGDTVSVIREETGEKIRIRLYGVDAPEGPGKKWNPQPYSRQATNFVKKLLPTGSLCEIIDMGYDKYSRTVGGIITLPDGTVVQEELVKAGLAWVDPRYCESCEYWEILQKEARNAGRGLWREQEPVSPWEWRGSSAIPSSE